MRSHLFTILLCSVIFSCSNKPKEQAKNNLAVNDTLQQDSTQIKDPMEEILKTIPKNIKPVFGYRFILSGDFNGDGKKDQLIEHFCSGKNKKETNKFYENLNNYDQLVTLTIKKDPISFITSIDKKIDTLQISSGGQLLGLSFLKNEGDLNGDGTDEVSYVVNWADWSNLNSWHIMTYKNNKWQELYSFPIWDSQIPDLPETLNNYGYFGLENKEINTSNDSLNKHLEKELLNFKGLVKKIEPNKIQVVFRNKHADKETKIVNLKRLK